jgi:hypothetical protein
MKNWRVAALAVLALSGCASTPMTGPDKVLIEHGSPGLVSIVRTGVVFGSIGVAPRDESISAMSVHLRSLDSKDHRFEIFATNRTAHPRWRSPDVDTESQRVWVFSGALPVGRYEIALAAWTGDDIKKINWIHFKPSIPVTVTTDGAVYVGRWQFTPLTATPDESAMRIPGTPLGLRDMPVEDQVILARQRGESPIGKKSIDDVLRKMMEGQGRI